MGIRPDAQSFPITSGESVQLEFTVKDNDDAVVDLTGGSGRFAAARNPSSSSLVLDSDASPQTAVVAIVVAANGTVNVSITAANTEALQGDYYYEFKWTDSSSNEAIVAWGWLTFVRNLI